MSTSALIGHTGFVGGTLLRARHFDTLINSKNTAEFRDREFDLVIHAGVPAVKWLANKDPANDLAVIQSIRDVLATARIKELILISTIDVYPDTAAPVDETAAIDPTRNHAYGRHRFELERWAMDHQPNVRIIRLPALFGDGLKKNVVFDLLHDNQLANINPATCFQWYPLRRLNADIERVRAEDIRLINLFPEPIRTSEIVNAFFPGAPVGAETMPAASYALRTKYWKLFNGPEGYMLDGATVLGELADFVARERSKRANVA
jgi:hypothetical protein